MVKKKKQDKGENHTQPAKLVRQKSKDDFDMVYQTPPPVVEEAKPSRISRLASYIMESRVGKVLFGSALSRTITILFTTSILSGVFPPAIPFAITAAIISLTAVGVGAIVDTMRTRSVRKLAEESDLLVKNRTALSKQEYILQTLDPALSEILGDQLHRPKTQQRDNDNYYIGTGKTVNIGQIILDTAPSAANLALNSMIAISTGSPMAIAKAISAGTMTAAALIGGGAGAKSMVNITKGLKLHINEERLHTEKYKDVAELRKNVERQEIQTQALQKLMQDKNYFNLTPQEKRKKFEELTNTMKKAVTAYSTLPPQHKQEQFNKLPEELQQIVSQPVAKSGSILSDAGRAHDPFYVQPTKKQESGLTKSMASEKAAKESAKSIVTPEVRDHIVSAPKKSKHDVLQESFDKFGSVNSEDLSKLKKAASHLDLADAHSNKVQTQPKDKSVKAVR